MPDWIIKYWVQWLFGLICAALLAGYRHLAKRVKEQEEERKAIKAGLLAILHDRLYAECSRCLAQGASTRTPCGIWNTSTAATMLWAATARAPSCTTALNGPADQERLNTSKNGLFWM